MKGARVRQVNDDALEILILAARAVSVVLFVPLAAALVAAVWFFDQRFLWIALLVIVFILGTGWFGWVLYGNATWRPRSVPVPECGAKYGELVCTREPREHLLHWDQQRDPDGKKRWS